LLEENVDWIFHAPSVHSKCTKYVLQNAFIIVPQLVQMMLHFMWIQNRLFNRGLWLVFLLTIISFARVFVVFFFSSHIRHQNK